MGKTIWIDLDNSPHVPLFIPIISELESRGHTVVLTARDFAQTVGLLKETQLPFNVIGSHYGKNKIYKLAGLFIRVFQLIRFIRKFKIDAAMNHGSRSHTLACWLVRIPVFCGLDYEHTESFIFSRFATRLWIPEGISEPGIKAIGAQKEKIVRYKGYKEHIYLSAFVPDPDFKKKLGVEESRILVTLRPPATHANYHHAQSEKLLSELIAFLKTKPDVYVICLPRMKSQAAALQQHTSAIFVIPETVVEGKNLAYYSDLVISGGGTMNREAALLGTPVYSIFSGKLGSLDDHMQKNGLLKFIHDPTDILRIEVKKKILRDMPATNPSLVKFLTDELLSLAK